MGRAKTVRVEEAIAAADVVLRGHAAPEGETDPRWQAIIAVAEFITTDPEPVWLFALKWGRSQDEDLRAAIGTCVLEHLLEHHFDRYVAKMEAAVLADAHFAATTAMCFKFGQSESSAARSARFNRLMTLARRQQRPPGRK
jgi:hypothetical protein